MERSEKPAMGSSRPNVKILDDCDPYGINIAPLNMFEEQVLAVGVHNLFALVVKPQIKGR